MRARKKGRLPQLQSRPVSRRKEKGFPWGVLIISALVVVVTLTAHNWLPGLVRRVVPDRYLVAYLPEGMQDFIFDIDPEQTLPTGEAVSASSASALLAQASSEQPDAPAEDSGAAAAPQSEDETPSDVILTGFDHHWQAWNNCGPATLSTYLSYWGFEVDQLVAASTLKPNLEDSNVRPDEIEAYVESLGHEMIVRINGDVDLLRSFLDASYPIMIETGYDADPEKGWLGHYLLVTGYSDARQTFMTMDSLDGPDIEVSYEELDRLWRHFNRVYMVAYEAEDSRTIEGIVSLDMDDATMLSRALERAQLETLQDQEDPFGWFNLGSVLVEMGNYEDAATAFDVARSTGTPWRMLWYQFGPYEAYLGVGGDRLSDIITLADSVLAVNNNPQSEEAYYYMGLALSAQGKQSEAQDAFRQALRQNPNYEAAGLALGGG